MLRAIHPPDRDQEAGACDEDEEWDPESFEEGIHMKRLDTAAITSARSATVSTEGARAGIG